MRWTKRAIDVNQLSGACLDIPIPITLVILNLALDFILPAAIALAVLHPSDRSHFHFILTRLRRG